MNPKLIKMLPRFLDRLRLDEEPVGIFHTDHQPDDGFSPKAAALPTREREIRNEIDWKPIFGQFSCVMGNIWRARKKKTAAWFDAEHFGCPGGAFWLGFMKPQTEMIINYVSSGVPGHIEGERYCSSPDELRRIFKEMDPVPAPKKFCVLKPLSLFGLDEEPLFVSFFTRPEPLCGLHQLAFFVTNDLEIVASPWGPACGGLISWPMKYLDKGMNKAVLGGWDPSARKFFKTDEMSFTVPWAMFNQMLERYEESFLTTKTWEIVQKKATRSQKIWTT